MARDILRIGVIGASPSGSWGANAHIPAIKAAPNLQLTAICTSRLETAQESARKYGAAHAFADPRALAEHPEVDAVAVCVRVPTHFDLVNAVLDAGKAIYCEWPLGRDVAEAEQMTARAHQTGVTHFTGLQARHSPVLAFLRDQIRAGAIGEVHATTLLHSSPWFAPGPSFAYLQDFSSGANFLTIPGGHSIDALCWLLGEFATLQATMTRIERGVDVSGTSPNQIIVSGLLADGTAACVRLQGAPRHGAGLWWEINGSQGDFVVASVPGGANGVQMADLLLRKTVAHGRFEDVPVPDAYYGVPEAVRRGVPLNVAKAYQAFYGAVADGRPAEPDFDAALARHRTLDAVVSAANLGRRFALGPTGWAPEV